LGLSLLQSASADVQWGSCKAFSGQRRKPRRSCLSLLFVLCTFHKMCQVLGGCQVRSLRSMNFCTIPCYVGIACGVFSSSSLSLCESVIKVLVNNNFNYPQTRKSSLTGHGDVVGAMIDTHVRNLVGDIYDAKVNAYKEDRDRRRARAGRDVEEDDGGHGFPKPAIASVVLRSSTAEEYFHRCAPDFNQVTNASKLEPLDLAGRYWKGQLSLLDEGYDWLQAFGLLSDDTKATQAKSVFKVNPHQSTMNKLLQSGIVGRATKTSGSYGDSGGPVSFGQSMNMHPSQFVPMEREEVGSHHVGCKERFLASTGRPIQPHDALPSDYVMPEGASRWRWVPLIPLLADILGLSEVVDNPSRALELLPLARSDEASMDLVLDEDDPEEVDTDFLPDRWKP